MKSIKLLAAVAALVAPFSAAQAVQGLNGAYYVGAYPAPTSGTPAATFLTNKVCFPGCGYDTNDGVSLSTFLGVPQGYTTNLSNELPYDYVGGHALTLSGYINAAGNHNFSLYSDDGSRLYIDGNLIVDNSGLHSPSTVTNSYNLTAGYHSILIYQDENGGGTALTAYMDGNPLGGSILSTTAGVPEPANWALMIGGFGVAGVAMRRRRAPMTVTA
jgi:uncharacterized protein (DUF2141 family)